MHALLIGIPLESQHLNPSKSIPSTEAEARRQDRYKSRKLKKAKLEEEFHKDMMLHEKIKTQLPAPLPIQQQAEPYFVSYCRFQYCKFVKVFPFPSIFLLL